MEGYNCNDCGSYVVWESPEMKDGICSECRQDDLPKEFETCGACDRPLMCESGGCARGEDLTDKVRVG